MADHTFPAPLTAAVIEQFLLDNTKQIYLGLVDTSTSVTLPTTPTVHVCPTVTSTHDIAYNTTTGIITFATAGNYSFNAHLNVVPSANGKDVFFYWMHLH